MVDKITVMIVDSGHVGQAFVLKMLDKIEALRKLGSKENLNYLIEIAGSCNKRKFRRLIKAAVGELIVVTSG